MAQLSIKNFHFHLHLLRRSYAVVAAESMRKQAVASVMIRKAADDAEKAAFWMRDPKTGNWIPENHFDDIDVADLREKLLPKNHK